ncbi:murein hydrolase activator EnvC [Pasteurella atlantica]|uniref:murein hydrolase activator EnvC n=1 Tax=Pasteurellaceae TaxID=712 RepID=UPI002746D70A|nr:murein hydrolase activator EnvC [Pasteurella atlantica]MDP8099660.1 murein hydrolase activator EnvC [Pasteurella atlantica]MDP8107612.1 murein hydrolase activator EnvC [Pasteurella atlantica]MDP8117306.1 murein hydrolase activator EnvC [Pasteurella atlantica]
MKLLHLYKIVIVILLGNLCLFRPVVASDLSKIQHKIKKQQDKIYLQRKKRNELQATLKKQELKISEVSQQLQKTEATLVELKQIIRKTEQQIEQLEKQENKQKDRLREQLDSAYRSGIHPSAFKRLLSKEAKDADRMAKYYEHMNQARIELIEDIRHTQSKLIEQRNFLEKQKEENIAQLTEQKSQKNKLERVTSQREKTISSINEMIEKDKTQLITLKKNAKALQDKIAKANREAKQRENREIAELKIQKERSGKGTLTQAEIQKVRAGNGLGVARKQYQQPVKGRIIQHFNPSQSWKGIVIKASAGQNVTAIASGRVILSDWLQGYGNVVFIDHGKGYSSIYGYNNSVLVKRGDRVVKGEVIAKVGNSGGQIQSGLYFGITYKGQAKNPLLWVK